MQWLSLRQTLYVGNSTVSNKIEPYEELARYPLSYAQQRLWFLEQLEGASALYNIPWALRLTGPLDLEALRLSVNEVIRRHASLRTRFNSEKGEGYQEVMSELMLELPLVDMRGAASSEVQARIEEEAKHLFDLERGPLIRGLILWVDQNEHILLLGIHHIISDGWSTGVLYKEVSSLYKAFKAGEGSPLPPLPIQYTDFTMWQRRWFEGEELTRQLEYWKEQLSGLEPLELPMDRPRPAVQQHRGGQLVRKMPEEFTASVMQFSRANRVTLFMTLLAAFQVLLYRYSGQQDIAVGTPIANRNRGEIEGLIGFFVNTLVMRIKIDGDESFRELLRRVQENSMDAYSYMDLPFEKLVEELSPQRDMSRNPLFQVMLTLYNLGDQRMELEGVEAEELQVNLNVAKFDLTLAFRQDATGLRATLGYNLDLFDPGTIERFLDHYEVLLRSIVADPDTPVSRLPLLLPEERQRMLVEWNNIPQQYDRLVGVPELFTKQVQRRPDAAAVVYEDQELTYGELNSKANQLARHLQQLGVGPGVAVGQCMERSLEMVVGLLGILKAGGVYVPLDPSYPRERLKFMLADAGIALLLTQHSLLEQLPETDGRIICLDRDWQAVQAHTADCIDNAAAPEDTAYMIYTSGSTGKPKGVMIPHSAISNYCQGVTVAWSFTSADRYLQSARSSFDVSLAQTLLPLTCGATIVLSPENVLEPVRLSNILRHYKITTSGVTPAHWQQWLDTMVLDGNEAELPDLRLIIVGGDVMPLSGVRKWNRLNISRAVKLLNAYGPTETTITTTSFHVPNPHDLVVVPIGRPLPGRSLYILDAQGAPVPVGVVGELHIGGDCLAQGYLNRPELTAEKFVRNPFSGDPGARLYRTGDLARYLPDGNIDFLGRIDFQVKIRGFRIELGEIEAGLSQHPGVKETVVVAVEHEPGEKRLVAYIVPNQHQPPSTSELHQFLKAMLPEYMVPSAFVTLDTLPLSPNGKVDRRALPLPDHTRPELSNAFVAPRTPVEETLASIWQEVLGLDQIGVNDNFFELGGHSLTATQVVSRVCDAFQIELPLRRVFDMPALVDLADAIMQEKSGL